MPTRVTTWILLGLIVVGCAGPQPQANPQRTEAQPAARQPQEPAPGQVPAAAAARRLVVSVPNEPVVLYYALAPAPTRGGVSILQDMINPGLTAVDNTGRPRAVLAEAVPSVENGLWEVLPDGRMQTTWKIRPGAAWHDGTPLTSDDLAFTMQVARDPEIAAMRNRNFQLIEAVTTPDASTVVVSWSRPFINADTLFTVPMALPMPKHILEGAYTADKATLTEHPYWTDEYLGLGPYRLREWVRGSHLIVGSFEQYVLGRPKIAEVEFRLISDPNTLVSNVLAGSVDLWRGAFLGVDQGIEVRDRWQSGKVHIVLNNWVVMYPQHVNASPPMVANAQFKKALLHGIDRKEMADSLMAGLVPVAHSPFNPTTREYKETEAGLVTYEFDTRRSAQLLEGLGYTRGGDGVLRDAQGTILSVHIHGTAHREIVPKSVFPVASYWEKLGVQVEPVIIPTQRASDREEQSTFPSFLLVRQGYSWDRVWSYHSAEARLPERDYSGRNNGRYMNPELDALIDRYWVAIPWNERIQVTTQILHHITDNLPVIPLFYDMDIALVSDRVQKIDPFLGGGGGVQAWNAYEWELR